MYQCSQCGKQLVGTDIALRQRFPESDTDVVSAICRNCFESDQAEFDICTTCGYRRNQHGLPAPGADQDPAAYACQSFS